MENEVIRLMSQSSQSVEAVFLMQSTIDQMKLQLLKTLTKQLEAAGKFEMMDVSIQDGFPYAEDSAIAFALPEYDRQIALYFGFDDGLKKSYIAVGVLDDATTEIEYAAALKQIAHARLNPLMKDENWAPWIFIHYFQGELQNWNVNKQIWIGIPDGTTSSRLIQVIRNVRNELQLAFNELKNTR